MRWRRMKPMKKTSMDAYCAIQSLFVPASLRQSVPLSAPVRHDPPPLFVSLQTEEKGACADGMSAFAQSRAEQSRAEQSRAEQSRDNTVLLDRSSEDCCLRKAFSDFLRTTDFRPVRERKPRTAAVQASACRLDPARNQFPYASCADISGSRRLFHARFSRF